MRPEDIPLSPKERVALGVALFFLMFAFLGIGYAWSFFAFSGKGDAKPATRIEETSPEVHAALDRAMSEISNQVNRALRPSDFR